MSSLRNLSALVLSALVALPLAAHAHPRYTVTPVGVAGSVANDINSSGAVVGNFPFSATSTHGFFNIVIVGTSINPDGYRRAFRYEGGSMADLGTLGGNNSAGADINNRGDIAGSADAGADAALDVRAFLLRPGVTMQDLGRIEVPDPEGGSNALGLNEYRRVVGVSAVGPYTPPESAIHAFLYKCEEMLDLGTLGGH